MADNSIQIDELRLDITVEDKTSGESSSKKVRALSTAISRLDKVISNFNATKMKNVFDKMTASLKPFTSELKKSSKEILALNSLMKDMGIDKVSNAATDFKLEKETTEVPDFGEGELPNVRNTQVEQLEYIKQIAPRATNEVKKLNIEVNKWYKPEKKKTVFDSLTKSIGRIAIYRLIRTAIKAISQAFIESIGGIARYSSEFNTTMTNITSSFDRVKTSIGVALYQPLMALEPVIVSISNAIVDFSNGLSFLFAKLRGASTFIRINTEYLKDYKSTLDGTLLSFDTFETLGSGKGIDYSQMIEEVSMSADGLDRLKITMTEILVVLGEISAILIGIGIAKIITWISSGAAMVKLFASMVKLSAALSTTAGIVGVISAGVVALTIGIMELIKNWNNVNFGGWEKAITIVSALTAGIIGTVVAVKTLALGLPAALGIGAILTGIVLAIGSNLATQTKAFANGGMFEGTGTMYALTGESGAEIVAQGTQGTGVVNVDQFADAMVSALVRYGAARDTNNGGSNIYLDGNKVGQMVASSAGFRAEANRRNSGLNWK